MRKSKRYVTLLWCAKSMYVSYRDSKYQALELLADNNGGVIGHGMPNKDGTL